MTNFLFIISFEKVQAIAEEIMILSHSMDTNFWMLLPEIVWNSSGWIFAAVPLPGYQQYMVLLVSVSLRIVGSIPPEGLGWRPGRC